LLQKVANLGQIGDRVKVSPVTREISWFPPARHNGDGGEYRQVRSAAARTGSQSSMIWRGPSARLEVRNFKLELRAKAGPKASCSLDRHRDIAEAAVKAGQPISRSEVRMPTGPIRVTGEHQGPAALAHGR